MPLIPEVFVFPHDDPSEVAAIMRELAVTGSGWFVLSPHFDPDSLPPPAPLMQRLFSARGPTIPELSWVPRDPTATKGEPTSFGIRHGMGHARKFLAEKDHPVPQRWVVLQDSPKRGLVVALPDDEPADVVLAWLLRATEVLCPLPLPGDWRAQLFRR